jgi:hypothetical protein
LAGAPGHAEPAIQSVAFFDDGQAHADLTAAQGPLFIGRALPFCPTDRVPCDEQDLAWVQMRISLDVYSARRNDPHDSIARILSMTREDLAPLHEALLQYFTKKGIESDVKRVAFVQGLVQAVSYEEDQETGWTDYPKFGIEFLVDEQGDCDDAAILATLLLESLGYQSYFVYWKGEPLDHLSTAIAPSRGDLVAFAPPPGSPWIEAPGLPRLLHVDGVSTPGGCGRKWIGCQPLGFNDWHKHGLTVSTVIRSDAPDLEPRMPLSAWSNEGVDRPSRELFDRRRASDEEIRQEVFAPAKREAILRKRLQGLGIEKDLVGLYLSPRRVDPVTFYTFLVICFSFFFVVGGVGWQRRRKRVKRVHERRAMRAEQF